MVGWCPDGALKRKSTLWRIILNQLVWWIIFRLNSTVLPSAGLPTPSPSTGRGAFHPTTSLHLLGWTQIMAGLAPEGLRFVLEGEDRMFLKPKTTRPRRRNSTLDVLTWTVRLSALPQELPLLITPELGLNWDNGEKVSKLKRPMNSRCRTS